MLFHIVFPEMTLTYIDIMAWNLANFLKLGGMFSITRQYLLLEMFDVELKKSTNDNKYLICLFVSWVFNIYVFIMSFG